MLFLPGWAPSAGSRLPVHIMLWQHLKSMGFLKGSGYRLKEFRVAIPGVGTAMILCLEAAICFKNDV